MARSTALMHLTAQNYKDLVSVRLGSSGIIVSLTRDCTGCIDDTSSGHLNPVAQYYSKLNTFECDSRYLRTSDHGMPPRRVPRAHLIQTKCWSVSNIFTALAGGESH